MSETKISYALKYDDGRYLSWGESNFPLTKHLREARRFANAEQIAQFLTISFYRPEVYGMDSADFEIVEIEISYKERVKDADTEGRAEESEVAVRN